MSKERKTNGHAKPEDFLLPRFEEVELPSGLKAKLRPPTLDMWMLFGDLPSRLLAESKGEEAAGAGEVDRAQIVAWLHHQICYVFIEPRFSLDEQPCSFHPEQLSTDDREFVGQWCQKFQKAGGGAGLGRFRSEAGEPGGDGPGSEAVRESSK